MSMALRSRASSQIIRRSLRLLTCFLPLLANESIKGVLRISIRSLHRLSRHRAAFRGPKVDADRGIEERGDDQRTEQQGSYLMFRDPSTMILEESLASRSKLTNEWE